MFYQAVIILHLDMYNRRSCDRKCGFRVFLFKSGTFLYFV